MWGGESFMRAPGHLGSKSAPCSPIKPFQKRAPAQPDSFHVIHKVPLGDSPYVKAKHVQLVDKDPDAAIALFWAAINAGDRVDSALKDMAIVMKQQNRPEEAIEAIKSLRYRCSDAAQESLDNVLLDLYKRCGRLDDQISLLKHKLHLIHQGMAFNGKRTKTARSQGKKFQVSIEQEATRLLGNLGWAYMQQSNFLAAEAVYRKALSIGPDNNKVCNLGICLMKQGRMEEAKVMLQSVVPACPDTRWGSDSHLKSFERAQEMLVELEASMGHSSGMSSSVPLSNLLQSSLWQPQAGLNHHSLRSASESKAESLVDYGVPFSGALSATAGFGPAAPSRPAQKKPVASSASGHHQRSNSHDVGGNQFLAYQSSGFKSAWEDYEPGYISPDENVDANVRPGLNNSNSNQGLSASSHFQWPGEALRQKQDSFSAASGESITGNQNQPLGTRKLERSLTFGAVVGGSQRDSSNVTNSGLGNSFGLPQIQRDQSINHQRENTDMFSGRIPSSPLKPGSRSDRAPLTYDSSTSISNKPFEEGNGASKQITSGWGKPNAQPMKSPLGNSELSFFSRWGYNENRPVVRRSLSLESFDSQLEQIALENEQAAADDLLPDFSLQPGGHHVKRPRNQTPVKEKVSLWTSLGFTLSPENLGQYDTSNEESKLGAPMQEFTEKGPVLVGVDSIQRGEPGTSSSATGGLFTADSEAAAGNAEMIKRQRRLRVFQEITLFPGSPQQIGV